MNTNISLAKFIPIELVNHILSFRPRHPNAYLIKEFKESYLNKNCRYYNYHIGGIEYYHLYKQTFKQINDSWKMLNDSIFSRCVRENCIYKIATKESKDSDWVYGKKIYTEKKAKEIFIKKSYHTYMVQLIYMDIDTLDEEFLLYDGLYDDDDDDN